MVALAKRISSRQNIPWFANKHFFNPILNDPEAPKILKDMVVKQQEKIASDAKRPAPFVQRADSDYVPF